MTKVDELFDVISSKLDIYESYFNEGATENEINEVENITGLKIPDSLSELLQKANGEKKYLAFLGHNFLSCSEIISQWNGVKGIISQKDFDEGERLFYQKELLMKKFFSIKRLPFAHDGSGQFLCIDYDPGPKGIFGQIVYIPMGEPEPMSVIASNFDEFISFIISVISSGELALFDEREDYEEDEKEFAEVYFDKTWRQDWTEIADRYNMK